MNSIAGRIDALDGEILADEVLVSLNEAKREGSFHFDSDRSPDLYLRLNEGDPRGASREGCRLHLVLSDGRSTLISITDRHGRPEDVEFIWSGSLKRPQMTMDELREAKREIGEQEHARRWNECCTNGGCDRRLAEGTPSGFQEYCSHCLTLWATKVAQDPPPLDVAIGTDEEA